MGLVPHPLISFSLLKAKTLILPRGDVSPLKYRFHSNLRSLGTPKMGLGPRRDYAPPTTRSDRIRIKTALDFNVPIEKICRKYNYTKRQIRLPSSQSLLLKERQLWPETKNHYTYTSPAIAVAS